MPPKRRRDEDEEAGDDAAVQEPRTPKKPRTTGVTTSRTSGRARRPAAKLVEAEDCTVRIDDAPVTSRTIVSKDDDEEGDDDDDDLAVAQVMQDVRTTPKKTPKQAPETAKKSRTPRKTKGIHDTPSKSTARRKGGRVVEVPDDPEEIDPAADLVLRFAGQEESDGEQQEAPASDMEDSDGDEQETDMANGVALQGGFEAYFEQAARKQKTSNNTLSKLPVLQHKEYLRLIKTYRLPYGEAMGDLYQSHVRSFPEWSFELDQRYSLCLTGYGSKKNLIQDFCAREAREFGDPYVVINGYHPDIDLRQICLSITAGLEETATTTGGGDVDAVLEALDGMSHDRLILAIHNIDGTNLRNEKVQVQLARMVSHPRARLICSIDHVNAPLLFSSTRTNDFRLLFHDATTFEPYTTETELQQDVLQSSTKTALVGDRGIKWILQTLSQNARTIFRILLMEQLATGFGMDSVRLFEKASAAFAVSNKTSYNAQLGEFLDHEIIVTERGGESHAEILKIPFAKAELQRLLEDIDGEDASE